MALTSRAEDFNDWYNALVVKADLAENVPVRGTLKQVVENGFARVWYDGDYEDELQVKEQTKATNRCSPNGQPGGTGRCNSNGREANRMAIFSRAY